MEKILSILVKQQTSIKEAVDILNDKDYGILLVVDDDRKLKGVVKANVIRDAILEADLEQPIKKYVEKNPQTGQESDPVETIKEKAAMAGGKLPIVDGNGRVVDLFIEGDSSDIVLHHDVGSTLVRPSDPIRDVIRTIDRNNLGIALVTEHKLVGLVTDKDIRSAILEGIDTDDAIETIMNRNYVVGRSGASADEIRKINRTGKNIKIPLVDEDGKVKDLVSVGSEAYSFFVSKSRPGHVKRVLVTGGAGYIGSILVRKLLERGYFVVVLDRLLYGDESIKDLYGNPMFNLITGDIRNIENITKAVKDVDAVIHLAGIVGDPACALRPVSTVEQNYLATVTLAQVCKYHQVNRFIFASSCSVYGQSQEVLKEGSGLSPVSLYARDKILSEKGLLSLMDENFSPTIMRMGTIYGLSYRPRFDLVLNLLTAMAVTRGEFTVFGGDQWRPMVHVDDAAEAYVKALEAPIEKVRGEIFNVGSDGQNYKIVDLGNAVHRLIPSSKMEVSHKDTDRRDYRVSFKKISSVLGYRVSKTIDDGVNEIRDAIIRGDIKDFSDPKYSNVKHLSAVEKKA